MISPISTNSGTAMSVNEFAVFHTMSPSVGHSAYRDSSVMPTRPTSPIGRADGHAEHEQRAEHHAVHRGGVSPSSEAHVEVRRSPGGSATAAQDLRVDDGEARSE